MNQVKCELYYTLLSKSVGMKSHSFEVNLIPKRVKICYSLVQERKVFTLSVFKTELNFHFKRFSKYNAQLSISKLYFTRTTLHS